MSCPSLAPPVPSPENVLNTESPGGQRKCLQVAPGMGQEHKDSVCYTRFRGELQKPGLEGGDRRKGDPDGGMRQRVRSACGWRTSCLGELRLKEVRPELGALNARLRAGLSALGRLHGGGLCDGSALPGGGTALPVTRDSQASSLQPLRQGRLLPTGPLRSSPIPSSPGSCSSA